MTLLELLNVFCTCLKPLPIFETQHIATQYWNNTHGRELARIHGIHPHIKYKLTGHQFCIAEPNSCSPTWTRPSHQWKFIYFSLKVHGMQKYHLCMLEALHLGFVVKVALTKFSLGLGFHLSTCPLCWLSFQTLISNYLSWEVA